MTSCKDVSLRKTKVAFFSSDFSRYSCVAQHCVCEKLLLPPESYGDSCDSVLSSPQSVSCQYSASRMHVYMHVHPNIRRRESRILCGSCISRGFPSVFLVYFVFYGIIAVRDTKLLLRDLEPLKVYISLISLVAPRRDLSSLIDN